MTNKLSRAFLPATKYHRVSCAKRMNYFQDQAETILETLHLLANDFYRNRSAEFLNTVMKVLKYDGVMVNFDSEIFVIAFQPNQVKSAIGNIGKFSKKTGKIHEEL